MQSLAPSYLIGVAICKLWRKAKSSARCTVYGDRAGSDERLNAAQKLSRMSQNAVKCAFRL